MVDLFVEDEGSQVMADEFASTTPLLPPDAQSQSQSQSLDADEPMSDSLASTASLSTNATANEQSNALVNDKNEASTLMKDSAASTDVSGGSDGRADE